MKPLEKFLTEIIGDSLAVLKANAVPLFTFALYHDHESAAVSVCADTESNSQRSSEQMNKYSIGHFLEAVERGDLKHASLWQANIGRSLSLGDFAYVNLARRDLGRLRVGKDFHLTMVRAVIAHRGKIVRLSPDPARLMFCCSSADDEVGYVWSSFLPEAPA